MCCFSIMAHIIWKEVWSSRKKKKPTNMNIFFFKNTLCAKTTNTLNRTRQDSVARRPSEREEAKTKMIAITVTRSVGPDIKVYLPDDVSDIVFMVFKFCCFMTKCLALWMMTFPLQCAVSLLKAEIYRITSIPPENQRIKFEVNVLAGSLKTFFYPLCRGLSCTRTGQGCPMWGSPTAPPSTLPSTPLTRCICTNIWHSAVWEILTFQGSYREI